MLWSGGRRVRQTRIAQPAGTGTFRSSGVRMRQSPASAPISTRLLCSGVKRLKPLAQDSQRRLFSSFCRIYRSTQWFDSSFIAERRGVLAGRACRRRRKCSYPDKACPHSVCSSSYLNPLPLVTRVSRTCLPDPLATTKTPPRSSCEHRVSTSPRETSTVGPSPSNSLLLARAPVPPTTNSPPRAS